MLHFVSGLDALVPATKPQNQQWKIQQTTPNATITTIAIGHRTVIANVNVIVSVARNTVPDIRMHIKCALLNDSFCVRYVIRTLSKFCFIRC